MKSIAAAILILASLAADAMAQEAPKTGGALIGRFWESIGLRAPAAQAPDFVRDSRPGATEFLPLSPTPGPTKKKTAAEMQALGASLNAAIAANRAKAARVKTPDVASQRRSR